MLCHCTSCLCALAAINGKQDPWADKGFNDGLMAQALVSAGWGLHRVSGRCLVEHAPSPQACALSGRVWDDSVATTTNHTGGRCISLGAAKLLLQQQPDLEVVTITPSSDGTSFGWPRASKAAASGSSSSSSAGAGGAAGVLPLRCIRHRSRARWDMARFFGGELCAARPDRPAGSPITGAAMADRAAKRAAAAAAAVTASGGPASGSGGPSHSAPAAVRRKA